MKVVALYASIFIGGVSSAQSSSPDRLDELLREYESYRETRVDFKEEFSKELENEIFDLIDADPDRAGDKLLEPSRSEVQVDQLLSYISRSARWPGTPILVRHKHFEQLVRFVENRELLSSTDPFRLLTGAGQTLFLWLPFVVSRTELPVELKRRMKAAIQPTLDRIETIDEEDFPLASLDRFVTAGARNALLPEWQDWSSFQVVAKGLFDIIDRNKNGQINYYEIKKAATRSDIHEELTKEQNSLLEWLTGSYLNIRITGSIGSLLKARSLLKSFIKLMDVEKPSGKIRFNELMRFAKRNLFTRSENPVWIGWEEVDQNQDGKVTETELQLRFRDLSQLPEQSRNHIRARFMQP